MQLSLLKTLFIIGTLAGVSMAQGGGGYGYGKKYHHRNGGVIKRTILIDGCTGKPVEKSYNNTGGEVGGGDSVVADDDIFEPSADPDYDYDYDNDHDHDQPTYPTSYDHFHDDDIFYRHEGYPAEDEIVDDYDYLGGGDISDNELII